MWFTLNYCSVLFTLNNQNKTKQNKNLLRLKSSRSRARARERNTARREQSSKMFENEWMRKSSESFTFYLSLLPDPFFRKKQEEKGQNIKQKKEGEKSVNLSQFWQVFLLFCFLSPETFLTSLNIFLLLLLVWFGTVVFWFGVPWPGLGLLVMLSVMSPATTTTMRG